MKFKEIHITKKDKEFNIECYDEFGLMQNTFGSERVICKICYGKKCIHIGKIKNETK